MNTPERATNEQVEPSTTADMTAMSVVVVGKEPSEVEPPITEEVRQWVGYINLPSGEKRQQYECVCRIGGRPFWLKIVTVMPDGVPVIDECVEMSEEDFQEAAKGDIGGGRLRNIAQGRWVQPIVFESPFADTADCKHWDWMASVAREVADFSEAARRAGDTRVAEATELVATALWMVAEEEQSTMLHFPDSPPEIPLDQPIAFSLWWPNMTLAWLETVTLREMLARKACIDDLLRQGHFTNGRYGSGEGHLVSNAMQWMVSADFPNCARVRLNPKQEQAVREYFEKRIEKRTPGTYWPGPTPIIHS